MSIFFVADRIKCGFLQPDPTFNNFHETSKIVIEKTLQINNINYFFSYLQNIIYKHL